MLIVCRHWPRQSCRSAVDRAFATSLDYRKSVHRLFTAEAALLVPLRRCGYRRAGTARLLATAALRQCGVADL